MHFKKEQLNKDIITIGRTLLQKNIGFCLYRFPEEKRLRIAIEKQPSFQNGSKTFWIAPFVPESSAKEIFLSIVENGNIDPDFWQRIQELPDQEPGFSPLPYSINKEEYNERLQLFLNSIKSGELNKAILSRVIKVDKPEDFDPFECFMELNSDYHTAFIHLLYHPAAGMWMGASPELLLKNTDSSFETMALAATQPRQDDHQYSWRAKETEEHQMVGHHIENVLGKLHCIIEKKEGPYVVEAGHVAHLRTDYYFKKTLPVPIQQLVAELHPTPAVGGLPADVGVEKILKHEGYDRKYYCGFIGETNFENYARLFVNLRCMEIGKDSIAIFAGGGITAASDPEEEWNETVEKSKTMLNKILSVKDLLPNEIVR